MINFDRLKKDNKENRDSYQDFQVENHDSDNLIHFFKAYLSVKQSIIDRKKMTFQPFFF